MLYDYSLRGMTLTGRGDPHNLRTAEVSGNFFATLGVHAEIGRHLRGGRHVGRGSPLSVVLSHATWVREFGGDPAMVGTSIRSRKVIPRRRRDAGGVFIPFENADMWSGFHWSREDMAPKCGGAHAGCTPSRDSGRAHRSHREYTIAGGRHAAPARLSGDERRKGARHPAS